MAIHQVVDVVDERESGPRWDAWLLQAEALHGQPLIGTKLLHAESCFRAGWSPVRSINTLP